MWLALLKFFVGPVAGPLFLVTTLLSGGALVVAKLESAATIAALNGTIDKLQARADQSVASLAVCQGNTGTLTAALADLNGQVAALGVKADAVAAAQARVAAEARTAADRTASYVKTVLGAPQPADGNVCGAALDLLREPAP